MLRIALSRIAQTNMLYSKDASACGDDCKENVDLKSARGELAPQGDVRRGIRDAFPVAVGYIPAAIAYGLLAKTADFPFAAALGLSLFVYAGASQFAAVTMLSAGNSILSTILLTFVLNLRHFLMTTTVSARLDEPNRGRRALVAFGITDETFSVASFTGDRLATHYLLALNTTAYLAWVGGSAVGFLVGEVLPESLQASMGIALYAMFIGLLIPNVRGSLSGLGVVLAAMTLNTLAQRIMPPGLAIVVVALAVTAVATLVLPDGNNAHDPKLQGDNK